MNPRTLRKLGGERPPFPAARLLAAASGSALLYYGLRRRGPLPLFAAMTGGALLVRSLRKVRIRGIGSMGGGAHACEVCKNLYIDAPVARVFDTLATHENWPLLMRHVRHARALGGGRSHWIVAGPAGIFLEWDSEMTLCQPNEVLAWRTVKSSAVAHAGILRFEPAGRGTRLDLQMIYSPPGGAVGYALARLFSTDAQTEIDQDLLQLKSFLEAGAPPVPGSSYQAVISAG
jgi:uncharacterized membrane protein